MSPMTPNGASLSAPRPRRAVGWPTQRRRERSERLRSPRLSSGWQPGRRPAGLQRRLLGDDRLKKRLAKVAPRLLDRLARKVEKRARKVNPEASPAVLHPLRKTLKKLRYGAEFVASLYPRKAVKRFLRPIKRLQETLGVINNSATATRLAVQLAGGGHLELGVPVGALAANRDEARRAAMRRLGKQWRELQRQKPFWK